jgi:DNA-directed RNA polymerase subunit RPC12/RpoP
MIYVVVGVPAVLALAIAGVHLVRFLRAGRHEEAHYLNCPHCRQRISFRARQAGHEGRCRRCGNGFVFPRPGSKALKSTR